MDYKTVSNNGSFKQWYTQHLLPSLEEKQIIMTIMWYIIHYKNKKLLLCSEKKYGTG